MPEIVIQAGDGNREYFPLVKDVTTIGRSRESDIFLPDQWLSRHHAEIRRRGEGWLIADLDSKNGTLLTGQPVRGEVRLRHGDVITLGEHTLTFTEAAGTNAEEADFETEGTRVFSARELSDINTQPAIDAQELARQNRVLAAVSTATRELLAHKPLSELFERILDLLFEAISAERGAILLLEEDVGRPTIRAARSRAGRSITHVSRAISRKVLNEKVSLLLPRILEDKEFNPSESILSSGIRSAMCAPLWYSSSAGGQEAVIGLVYLDTLEKTHSFGEEDLRILTALANVAAAKIENTRLLEEMLEKRRLEADIRLAAETQQGLLPKEAPAVPGYGLVGINQPCRTVGGDYYDFDYSDGRLLLALGDVAGKGMSAALIMTVLRAAVRDYWAAGAPGETVARLNRTVCQNVPDNKYVTFFLASLDPESGRITYVNAGHNPPLLVRAAGQVEPLAQGGTVLGMFDPLTYTEGVAEMRPGDTLLIYSDGISETFDPDGEEFGERGLAGVALRSRGLDAAALQGEILRELERFSAGEKASDDRTLIVLKRY
jgi:serine phosphatase RsbU (regulator of sigma subunit)/pSer/pThr/pTyr-binding forkhead associated (FHA) protein